MGDVNEGYAGFIQLLLIGGGGISCSIRGAWWKDRPLSVYSKINEQGKCLFQECQNDYGENWA